MYNERLKEHKIRVKTSGHIHTLFDAFGYERVFGRSDVMDVLGITATIPNSGGTLVTTSYTAEDSEIPGANDDYIVMQQRLVYDIRNTLTTHPGYGEYRYDPDEIGHNPILRSRLKVSLSCPT